MLWLLNSETVAAGQERAFVYPDHHLLRCCSVLWHTDVELEIETSYIYASRGT